MFQEFPKCLIKGEASVVVFDAEQEKVARAEGYQFHDEIGKEAEAQEPKRRGRPPKAE